MKIIQIKGFADGSASAYDDQYLERFDPDWNDGLGRIWTTTDPAKAMKFKDAGEALELWRKESTVNSTRADGKPNRPFTALTVLVTDAP